MIFNTVESFRKSFFYSGCKKLWVVQNYFPITTMLNKINVKTKPVSTFDRNTLHKLLNVLSELINFVFKSKVRKCICFSKTSIYWTFKGAGRRYFTK